VTSTIHTYLEPKLKKKYGYTFIPPLGLHGQLLGKLHVNFNKLEIRSAKSFWGIRLGILNAGLGALNRPLIRYALPISVQRIFLNATDYLKTGTPHPPQ
jgi:hypothetical protein